MHNLISSAQNNFRKRSRSEGVHEHLTNVCIQLIERCYVRVIATNALLVRCVAGKCCTGNVWMDTDIIAITAVIRMEVDGLSFHVLLDLERPVINASSISQLRHYDDQRRPVNSELE